MATRSGDPDLRARLLASGARLLAEEGPAALTTRRVAKEAGTSTMGVYTQFGSIADLVRAVVDDGFAELAQSIAQVERTDDPVRNLYALTCAYIDHARQSPSRYTVMLLTAPMGPFRPSTVEELRVGRPGVFDVFVDACQSAIDAGRFDTGDAWVIAHQWWCAVHGYVMLELAGYVRPPGGVVKVLNPTLEHQLVGLGDTRERAATSMAHGAEPRAPSPGSVRVAGRS